MALWLNRGYQYDLDLEGRIIGENGPVTDTQNDNSIKITNSASIQETRVGDRVISNHVLETIRSIYTKLPSQLGITFQLFDINEIEQGKIAVRTNKGWTIYFSTVADTVSELNKLTAFMLEKDRTDPRWRDNLNYIDLRFGNTRIYYK